jgi:hypothetical protein
VKQIVAIGASIALFGTAVSAFWYQDWRYSLPTPRPENLVQPGFGEALDAENVLDRRFAGRPLVIHVVNPDCPCSVFNREHMQTLVRRFGDRVTFVALVQGSEDSAALVRSFESWDLPMVVVADPGGRKAAQFGAYSTPQAVIVTPDSHLYFRGNYNLTRYHADPRSEFARIAIESLLDGKPLPAMPSDATVAYGCPLPHRAGELETSAQVS